ncbi:hypothetical protein LBMAG53_24100 [Planctomycetota bacterium]|nr:hypothetical protein LBMAG53_24100 [Planctomycetota bacterium]
MSGRRQTGRALLSRLSLVCLILVAAGRLSGAVCLPVPLPDEEPRHPDWQVAVSVGSVGGSAAVAVGVAQAAGHHGGPYGHAAIDADGPITVRIRHLRGLAQAQLRPLGSLTARPQADGSWEVTAPGPCHFVVLSEGKKAPLFISIRPPEVAPLTRAGPAVVYFGPGIHRPGQITLTSGQTLYLAPGAVVHGGVVAEDAKEIRICGRGVLAGDSYAKGTGPIPIKLLRCSGIIIEGVTLRGSQAWTLLPSDCTDLTIERIAILNGRFMNDDGINPCNSRRIVIRDSMIRSDDDCIAMKGIAWLLPEHRKPAQYRPEDRPATEDITIERMVFWSDRARVILIGHESDTRRFADIRIRDCQVAMMGTLPFLLAQPVSGTPLSGLTVERISIDGMVRSGVIEIEPLLATHWNEVSYPKGSVPSRFGSITGVTIRDLRLPACGQVLCIRGGDEASPVRGVALGGIAVAGRDVTSDAKAVQVGPYVVECTRNDPAAVR